MGGINCMRKEKELVSIIIPVFNSEQYLQRCFDSVISQTYENWEVVLVDDGSSDNSGSMCDFLSEKYNGKVKVIHKQNAGQGRARNDGLKSIQGSYVLFLDSDDYFQSKDAIEKLSSIANKYHPDIISTNFIFDDRLEEGVLEEGLYEGKKEIEKIIVSMVGYSNKDKKHFNLSACTKMYKMDFLEINGLLFPSERELIWEDLAFNFEAVLKAKTVYVMDYAYYHYCYNSTSTTHKYNPEKFNKIMIMYDHMSNRINKENLGRESADRMNNMFMGNIYTCIKLEALFSKRLGVKKAIYNISIMLADKRMKLLLSSIKSEQFSSQQRLFNMFMKNEQATMVYLLAFAQNLKKKNLVN